MESGSTDADDSGGGDLDVERSVPIGDSSGFMQYHTEKRDEGEHEPPDEDMRQVSDTRG